MLPWVIESPSGMTFALTGGTGAVVVGGVGFATAPESDVHATEAIHAYSNTGGPTRVHLGRFISMCILARGWISGESRLARNVGG